MSLQELLDDCTRRVYVDRFVNCIPDDQVSTMIQLLRRNFPAVVRQLDQTHADCPHMLAMAEKGL